MPNLLDKIEQLKQKFSGPGFADEHEIFNQFREEATKAELMLHLKNHEGMKKILRSLDRDLSEMDLLLLSADSKKLSDTERDRVLDRKKLYLSFRSFFTDAENTYKAIESQVDANLKKNAHL